MMTIMAEAFIDVAREMGRIDAADLKEALRGVPDTQPTEQARPIVEARGEVGACYDALSDARVAITTQDWPEARRQALRNAAHAVRLLMALPGGEE